MEVVNTQRILSSLYPQVQEVSFDEVELTPDEERQALNRAKALKAEKIKNENLAIRRQNIEKECLRPWMYEEIHANALFLAKQKKPAFELDQFITPVFELLCKYFTGDKGFENSGDLSLSKGICLTGNVGTGKTFLIDIFKRNKIQCFDIIPARAISEEFQIDGTESQKKFFQPAKALLGTSEYFLQRQVGLCIDDIGTEIENGLQTNYGNKTNVIQKVILNRYDNKLPYNLTHFTTNLTADQIEQLYGSRVRSRLREMVNFIELPGPDRRK